MIHPAKFEIEWRSVADDAPCAGMFVELSRDEVKGFEKVYWSTGNPTRGLFWRPVPTENFIVGPQVAVEPLPIDADFWYVVLVEPQQEVTTVWRLHEQGRELYVPIIRRRVKTGRTGRNGQKVTRILPRPMFPGYGLLRKSGIDDINDVLKVRGVRQMLRDQGEPIVLPHEAVLAIFRKQSQKHQEFHQEYSWRKRPRFKQDDKVRIEADGNVYDGHFATIEKDDGKGRIALLLGAAKIRHTLPADMVVAA